MGLDEAAERLLRNADDVADNADDNIDAPSPCRFNSFSADTMVMTDEGPAPISSLDVGDIVLAYNETTGEVGYYPITDTISHEDPVVQYLTINGETIITTPNHPFYTGEGEWVPAGQLQVGDTVRQADGSDGTVQASRFVYQPQPMYNLTVAEAHTYFVGDGEWLVHNNGKVCGFSFSDLRGKSENFLKRHKPQGWSTRPLDRGSGWKWLDENGQERLRFYRGTGLPPSHPGNKWARQSHGYIRWLNENGEYLDIDGNVIPISHPDFDWLTHIPYEGP